MKKNPMILSAAVFLILYLYAGPLRAIFSPIVEIPAIPGGIGVQTLLFLFFSLAHAAYTLGWRHTLIFFGITAVISWLFEQAGVATGLIYGPYHYTDVLGVKLGHVPLLIPLAWFMMIYPSYIITNLIVDNSPVSRSGVSTGKVIYLSFLNAMVMTAWDLVVDPLLSGPARQAWIWEKGGPYFDIPVQNFIGWMVTTFTVYLLYRLFERRVEIKPAGPMTTGITLMPLIAYGGIMISNSLSDGPDALHVIGPFVMGLPLALAAGSLLTRKEKGRKA